MDELAARLYVSRSKLCATFRQETGEAVGAYVRRRRGERAEELLAGGGATVAEVGGAPWLPQRRRLQPGLPRLARHEPQRLAGSAVETCPSCGVYPGMYAIAVLIFCHKKCDRPLTCGFLDERSF